MSSKKRPKCSGEMKKGIIAGALGWVEGRGLFGRKHRLSAYRCEECRYIELYAE